VENLGKYFLDLREQRGLSYARILEDIRIPEKQIRALEENRLFELGHYGFVKALVYNYARYLEADLDAVMREFAVLMPDNTKREFIAQRIEKEKKIMLSTNFLWTLGIAIFVAILGSILLYSHRQGWLQAPDFFSRDTKEIAAEKTPEPDPQKPDTLRQRMRLLSESIPAGNSSARVVNRSVSLRDTTDYIGAILGESPVNVTIN
jgi:cytoskeletal protein RodZ